jgi:large subunit ribosomal protein L15
MKLHDLQSPRGATSARRRAGRGTGGRRGKTAGRGTKGTGARGSMKPGFEGGQLPLAQRIPKLKGFHNPFRVSYAVVNLDTLEERFEGDEATPATLASAGLVKKGSLVKVLARGQLNRALRVQAHAVSTSARERIEAAGGTVEILAKPFGDRRPAARGNALTNR